MSAPGKPDSDRTLAGATRAAVLEAVRRADQPLTVQQIADRVGLHTNTVRFHLARLLQAGSLTEQRTGPSGPGRPRMVYTATPATPAEPAARPTTAEPDTGYRFLAEILAGHLAATSPAPGEAATAVGEAWGRYLADRPEP